MLALRLPAKLERCHIVPDSLGGEDTPSNFVILCRRCHLDNPNVADPEIMWDWLRAYGVPLYDTFWTIQGMDEYKKIYGVSVMEEFRSRGLSRTIPRSGSFSEKCRRAHPIISEIPI